jgi:glycosyltransferase involved in cell wall biosynthesis
VRIALDATYSIDPQPSGIAVYSGLLANKLPQRFPNDRFLNCYRWKQWRSAGVLRPNTRLLIPPLPTFRADLFHALNQRVDRRPSRVVVTTFHDLFVISDEYSTAEFRRRFEQQARTAAANSDVIIAVSEFTARQVTDLLNIDRARIRVIPHGISSARHRPPSEKSRKPLILFVGALQLRKNVERIVEAFETVPEPWHLVLAGSTKGFGSDAILQRIERSSVRERISVRGYVAESELRNLYETAAVFLFPSLDEGFGIPVLEAMAAGIPVITSNRSALAEVAGNAAVLVDPTDTSQIVSALRQLTGVEALRQQFIEAGLARVQYFSSESMIDSTYRVYREALG